MQNAGNCFATIIPIQADSKQDRPCDRDRAERAEQRKMDFYAKGVERIDHPRRVSLEPSVVPEPSTEEKEGENQPSVRDTKRACGEREQDLSGEIPVPSADETVDHSRDPLLRHLV